MLKITLMCLATLSTICTGTISPVLPFIKQTYSYLNNIDIIIKLLAISPHIAIAIFSPVFGYLIPENKRKESIVVFLILYALFGTIGLYNTNISVLLLSRFGLGFCISVILVNSDALIAKSFDGMERSSISGRKVTFMSVGTILASLTAGILGDIKWNYVFIIYSSSLFLIYPSLKYIKNFKNDKKNSENNSKENERHIHIKKNIIQNNYIIILILVFSTINAISFYTLPLQIPILLNKIGICKAKIISIALVSQTMMTALVSYRHFRIKKNNNYSSVCSFSFLIMSIACFLIHSSYSYVTIVFANMVYGVGLGLMMPNNYLWMISVTKPENRGFTLGTLSTSIFSGKILSVVIMYVLDRSNALDSIRTNYLLIGIAMLISATIVINLNSYFTRLNKARLFKKKRKKC